jgi:hypothetical protein
MKIMNRGAWMMFVWILVTGLGGAVACLGVMTTGCSKPNLAKSPVVGTWEQAPNPKRKSGSIVLVFKADGMGTQTLGSNDPGKNQAMSWSETGGVVTYKLSGTMGLAASALGASIAPCHISKDGKNMTWGKRGQITLFKK